MSKGAILLRNVIAITDVFKQRQLSDFCEDKLSVPRPSMPALMTKQSHRIVVEFVFCQKLFNVAHLKGQLKFFSVSSL